MNDIPITFLPPWPEWSDSEINTEKWDLVGQGSSKKTTAKTKNDFEQPKVESFEDPCGHGVLPPEFEAVVWKRPKEVNSEAHFCVVSNPTAPLDIFARNVHLLGSSIMQSLLMSILWLEKKGENSPFPAEFQGPKFQFPLTAWKPWHHVYSNCRIDKAAVHKPEYNSFGKYVVRVFFIGMWRRITVDDYLPFGEDGKALLPLARDPRELWLPILCKALLRIALIPDQNCLVYNLTGWLNLSISCSASTINQEPLWKALLKMKEENVNNPDDNTRMCVTTESVHCINDHEPMSCVSLKPSLIVMNFEDPLVNDDKYYAVSGMVYEIYDDADHIKAHEEIQKNKWKEFRWRKWAIEQGIIKDTDQCPGRKVILFGPMAFVPVNAAKYPCQECDSALDDDYFRCYLLSDLAENLGTLCIYYEQSEFEHSSNILNINDFLSSKTVEKKGGSKKDNKSSAKSTSARGQNETSQHSAGCFYIVSDSLFCKSIYFSCSGYCDKEKTDSTCFFVVVEKFSWKLSSMGKFLFSIQRYGTSSLQVLLGSGLQALRVWYSLPSNYFIQVLSKTSFALCGKEKAQELLALPSVTEKVCATTSSTAFKALLESTDNPVKHGKAIQEFFESLQPIHFHKLLPSWKQRFATKLQIIEAFEEIAVQMLFEKTENVEEIRKTLHSYRKLFLNPQFGRKCLRKMIETFPKVTEKFNLSPGAPIENIEEYFKNYEPSENEVEVKKTSDKKSVKGKRESTKEENLLLNKPENIISVLRKLIEKCPNVQKYYSFNDCSKSQLAYVDYNGTTAINLSGNILFLIRYILQVTNESEMPFSFHIFTAMEKLVIRMINNDYGEELPSGLSENRTYFLHKNKLGYTVFAQGELDTTLLAPKQTEMPWKLRVIGSVEHSLPYSFSPFGNQINSPPQSIVPLHFEGIYLPEKDHIFCRCVLNIKSNAVVTLHLIASSDTACITLVLKGNKHKYLAEAEGIHEVIIPVVFLNMSDGISSLDGEGVIFAVEGHVLKDSWELNDETLTALRNFREMRNEAGGKRLKKSSRKASIADVPGAELLPTWLLTAVFDSGDVANCKLLPDTQSEDEIRRQKESWITGDEKRRAMGMKAKLDFLSQFSEGISRKQPSKESILTPSEASMMDTTQANRTDSLMAALSETRSFMREEKYEDFSSATIEELIEDTFTNLSNKIEQGLRNEENLNNKLEASEKSFQNVSDYKNQLINEINEDLSPRKTPAKKGKRGESEK